MEPEIIQHILAGGGGGIAVYLLSRYLERKEDRFRDSFHELWTRYETLLREERQAFREAIERMERKRDER